MRAIHEDTQQPARDRVFCPYSCIPVLILCKTILTGENIQEIHSVCMIYFMGNSTFLAFARVGI